jgi:2-C-methyl-D-erythritol 4-phosphate cytidylyltransferase
MRAAAILLCAGKGERLGRGDKALVPLCGRPLFTWSLEALERTRAIDAVAMVGPVKRLQAALALAAIPCSKIVAWTEGGRERQDSVARGLAASPGEFDLIAIHDAARALVGPELIGRVVAAALESGAAIAALQVEETLKRATLDSIDATVPRSGLWRAQTPQVFRRDWLEAAHRETVGRATDDAALLEAAGRRVKLVPGESSNFKITTPEDLELAEAWLLRKAAAVNPEVTGN